MLFMNSEVFDLKPLRIMKVNMIVMERDIVKDHCIIKQKVISKR